jgi:hypothetical protein
LNTPELQRTADSIEFLWRDTGIGIGFSGLREKAGELHGEIWIGTDKPQPNQNGHIVWGSFNLSSPRSRSGMAKDCQSRANIGTFTQWESMLEYACLEAAKVHREGEPCIDLSEGEADPVVKWLAAPILAQGYITSLFADGDSGKGFIALGIALSLALGGVVIPGVKPLCQGKTLYLDWETDAIENTRRVAMLCRGLGIHTRPDGILYRRMLRPLADDLIAVRRIVDRQGIDLVVIDSAALAAAGELRETDPTLRFHAALRHLDATPFVLGHVSKATADTKGNERGRMFGSIFFENLSRACWEVRSDTETNPVTIGFFHRKANMGPKSKPFAVSLCFDDVAHSATFKAANLEDSAKVAEHAPLSMRIAAELRRGARTTAELAEELDVKPGVMRVTLNRAFRKGVVTQLSSGSGQGGRGNSAAWGLPAFDKGEGAIG